MCTCVQMCTMCFCVVNQHSKSAFRDTKCQAVVMKAKAVCVLLLLNINSRITFKAFQKDL